MFILRAEIVVMRGVVFGDEVVHDGVLEIADVGGPGECWITKMGVRIQDIEVDGRRRWRTVRGR
jgi:hypothetical protein